MININKYLVYTILVLITLTNTNCVSHNGKKEKVILTASISPIKYIVETITCGDFPVEIMVPAGASPESYSPTANQLVDIENSRMIFTTGLLEFEQELISKLDKNQQHIIDLSEGILLIEGSCNHDKTEHSKHIHGTDPHIWTSPKQLKVIASNVYDAVSKEFPDSLKYRTAYDKMISELDSLSIETTNIIKASGVEYFIIYHPALTYLARDYGLTQISLEDEGKEPSAQHMRTIIDMAHGQKIKYILYQKQFSRSVVEAIAKEIDAQPVEIDPLCENITEEIKRITKIIAE